MILAELIERLIALPDYEMVVTIRNRAGEVLSLDPLAGEVALDLAFTDPARTVADAWRDYHEWRREIAGDEGLRKDDQT